VYLEIVRECVAPEATGKDDGDGHGGEAKEQGENRRHHEQISGVRSDIHQSPCLVEFRKGGSFEGD
jgi:hypothetical protein